MTYENSASHLRFCKSLLNLLVPNKPFPKRLSSTQLDENTALQDVIKVQVCKS